MHFFSKDRQKYQHVPYSPARSSSEERSLSHDGLLEKDVLEIRQKGSFWQRHRPLIILHSVLFTFYAIFLYMVAASARYQALKGPALVYSPARDAVIWEEKKFVLGDRIQERSIYSGKPTPELDLAWHNLLNDENIRLEPEYLKRYGREDYGVRIPEGDGYIGTLNVYHELHCIKRLHQYMYQDYYWSDITDDQREMNRLHNEHCLDFLRQAAMCHGDIGLITFQWSPTNLQPIANATTHQCVNWHRLDEWTKARSVDMMKPGWLVHPTLGLAYPTGEGDRIGAATGGYEDHHHH